eukprot:3491823-Amphidinium_carterae.2
MSPLLWAGTFPHAGYGAVDGVYGGFRHVQVANQVRHGLPNRLPRPYEQAETVGCVPEPPIVFRDVGRWHESIRGAWQYKPA